MTGLITALRVRIPRRTRIRKGLQVFASYAVLVLLSILVLVPMLWALSMSFKAPGEIYTIPPTWLPEAPTLDNYTNVLTNSPIPRYFWNSVVVGVLVTGLSITVGGLAGYGFARFRFAGHQMMSTFVLSAQMVPLIVFIIPFYFLIAALGLIDNVIGLSIAQLVITLPLVIWMARSYFETIPTDLEDAAALDGCSRLQALRHVILPITGPGLAATGIYAFIMSWNEFVFASVLTSSDKSKTLPIGLTEFATGFSIDWGSIMAAVVLVTLPVLILFIWLQRYFVGGLAQGAVK